ncbi:MAG: hypothetical protein JW993_10005 [Sedimentisphaerales bacterium]|nr:hypothetical protein [Sedimentisphaerales bacterium]
MITAVLGVLTIALFHLVGTVTDPYVAIVGYLATPGVLVVGMMIIAGDRAGACGGFTCVRVISAPATCTPSPAPSRKRTTVSLRSMTPLRA